jgi:5'-3' exonuclease
MIVAAEQKPPMGIKGLLPFLDKQGAGPVKFAATDFAGCAVAIDGHGQIHRIYAVAMREVANRTDALREDLDASAVRAAAREKLLRFVLRWLSCKITPVFVFDGPAPPEKKGTLAQRAAEREERQRRLAGLRADVLGAGENELAEARRLIAETGIAATETALAAAFLRSLGVCVLKSATEGEVLCSMGARDGRFAAVFSADTDNLTYGCPLLLTDFAEVDGKLTFVGYELAAVLERLGLTFPVFVDLCVMAGCDYNDNIFRVGVAKSFKLLQRYASIDRLPPSLDVAPLKHRRCRELFAYRPFEDVLAAARPGAATSTTEGLEGLFAAPPAARPNSLALDATALASTGLAALEAAGLAARFFDDLRREMAQVPPPMTLAPAHPPS